MRRVAIEEHFRTQYYVDYLKSRDKAPMLESIGEEEGQDIWREWSSANQYTLWDPKVITKLCDIGEGRLKDMDVAEIDMQVLGFPPGIDRLDVADGIAMAKKVNDELSMAVGRHPDRLAGFASLPLKDPDVAAYELERAVKHLGLKGAMIFPHVEGEYIDHRKYWPIFERAARLDVPLYIHPAHPAPDNQQQYSGYPELVGSMWGFAAEAGLAAVRLICSGIFDEFPTLKIMLGHLGEALPFWMQRLDTRIAQPTSTLMKKDAPAFTPLVKTLMKLPSFYIMKNFFVTTSGMLWQPALLCSLEALGAERILFAVDYPFEPSQPATQFVDRASISDIEKEKIFHLNAERLVNL